jgi:ABC-type sugar transport system ATPase subunit
MKRVWMYRTKEVGQEVVPVSQASLEGFQLKKSYGKTVAVVDATVSLKPGTITGLVGENGSGKSTLVKILSGVIRPDSGMMRTGDSTSVAFHNPQQAKAFGIATVFQELQVVLGQSVFANVYLGADRLTSMRGRKGGRRAEASAILGELAGKTLDLETPVELLPLPRRQMICIARALLSHPKVLILDEATSTLDVGDRDRLFKVCAELRDSGVAILFISHRLEELLTLADDLVIMHDGRTVSGEGQGVDRGTILSAMRRPEERDTTAVTEDVDRTAVRHDGRSEHEPVLIASQVALGGGSSINVEVRPGEIVGLAGLGGHGQEEFLRVLAGIAAPQSGAVKRLQGGRSLLITSRYDAGEAGIVYLPRDRGNDGIFPSLSVLDNFALPTLRLFTSQGVLRKKAVSRRFAELSEQLSIRMESPRALITTLSGGSQQKILIARWLAADPQVLLLDDPTRGVDIPTKAELHSILRRRADAGLAVVMISTEVEELQNLCDRVLVFHELGISAVLEGDAITPEAVLSAMFGGEV